MQFPSSGFKTNNASEVLEEEQFENFKTGRYYPVNIGGRIFRLYKTRQELMCPLSPGEYCLL